MNLAATVSTILRQSRLSEIAFQLGSVQVTGTNFAQVAQAVEKGRIKCWAVNEFKAQALAALPNGRVVNARYEIDNDAMLFSSAHFGSRAGEDQTIVHEAVHAAIDLSTPGRSKHTTLKIEDEAAAILATAFYIRLCEKDLSGFTLGGGGEAEALQLATQALRDPGMYTVTRGRYYFTPAETEALCYAVSMSRNLKKYTGSDGLPTDDSTAVYVYNGVPACPKGGCR